MVKKKDLKKIERIEKKVTKHDLAIYGKLHKLLKQIYTLETKDNIKLYDRIKAKEKEVLRIIKQIRKDAVKELRFAQILRPKNRVQRAIVDIFGPFLSPEPVAVARAEYTVKNLGLEGLGVGTPGQPGQPFLTLNGQDVMFGDQSYSSGGSPQANLNAFGPALARAEGLKVGTPEFEHRSQYATTALARALHGENTGPMTEYRADSPTGGNYAGKTL